ncbi:MAG: hypothetical protein DBX47_01570 [Clostridiales bacterium]|nr:MAG: hypothetical protein DBX47_01570 [Clostridiales bacterium]
MSRLLLYTKNTNFARDMIYDVITIPYLVRYGRTQVYYYKITLNKEKDPSFYCEVLFTTNEEE